MTKDEAMQWISILNTTARLLGTPHIVAGGMCEDDYSCTLIMARPGQPEAISDDDPRVILRHIIAWGDQR